MTHPPRVDAGPAARPGARSRTVRVPKVMGEECGAGRFVSPRTPPGSALTPRMVISMNAPNPPALATLDAGGRQQTTALDLDTMTRIAEQAGRDALLGHADQTPFDAYLTLRAIAPTDDMLVTASRLYQACLRGALDPATE